MLYSEQLQLANQLGIDPIELSIAHEVDSQMFNIKELDCAQLYKDTLPKLDFDKVCDVAYDIWMQDEAFRQMDVLVIATLEYLIENYNPNDTIYKYDKWNIFDRADELSCHRGEM